jgi:lipopolysaccharide/colanic/teichoic acid biosynthesis glycosyltransferase
MEPDILASAGEPAAVDGHWSDANTVQSEEPPTVETPSDISRPRVVRLQAVSVHAPAVPRARVHAGGFANGFARPRTGPPAHWPAATPAATPVAPAVLPFETPESHGAYLRSGNRILDVVASAIALVVLSPVIVLLAIIVRATSRGPVFYRSMRIGRGGRPFTFYKLRSMVKDADLKRQHLSHLNEADGPVFKIARDPRITPIGRFMRSTSLDEVPQFWNVLKGDMSLVGPRPPIPGEVAQYEPWQLRRLDVRPGLTCLWQISGRSRIGFQEWMRLDLEYIRHRSLKLDLKILLRTIPAVLSREGAY